MPVITESSKIHCVNCNWEGVLSEALRGNRGSYFCAKCHRNSSETRLAFTAGAGHIQFIGKVKVPKNV